MTDKDDISVISFGPITSPNVSAQAFTTKGPKKKEKNTRREKALAIMKIMKQKYNKYNEASNTLKPNQSFNKKDGEHTRLNTNKP